MLKVVAAVRRFARVLFLGGGLMRCDEEKDHAVSSSFDVTLPLQKSVVDDSE